MIVAVRLRSRYNDLDKIVRFTNPHPDKSGRYIE